MKAVNQPGKKDLSVLSLGVPRTHVIAEIGPPVSTDQIAEGRSQDVFTFRQGYSKPVRVGRALAHGAADLMTGFLWELAGTPIEMIADGTEVKAIVTYDPDRNIESVQILDGESAFRSYHRASPELQGVAKRSAGTDPRVDNSHSQLDLAPAGGAYHSAESPELE